MCGIRFYAHRSLNNPKIDAKPARVRYNPIILVIRLYGGRSFLLAH